MWLKAIFALPLTDEERAIFQRCTGREDPPAREPSEAFTIVGRRGGKSFISALTAVFVACCREYREYLNAGEQAVALVLARDRDQAKIVFRYIKGILSAIEPLHAMVVNETADEIQLDNGVTLMVKTSDFRAIRGLTIALCVADEVAFWAAKASTPTRKYSRRYVPPWQQFPGANFSASAPPMTKPAFCSKPTASTTATTMPTF